MDTHASPISRETCDRVRPGLYDELQELGVTKVLNRNGFRAGRGFSPACSSIFLVGDGGTYDMSPKEGVHISVHNGTLVQANDIDYTIPSRAYEGYWHGSVPEDFSAADFLAALTLANNPRGS